ncbi:MAG: hypothetical protein QXZ02_03460 [Candidatus Bathyarchaeia archaeon]
MHRIKIALAVVLICVAGIFLVYAMTSSFVLRNIGAVKAIGVGVYWDATCSQAVSAIDWGILEPNASKNVTVYVRNEGNSAITLSLQTANWNPLNASDYVFLSWDYGGQAIAANSVIPVVLTLSISPNIQGVKSFSFDIIISASG